MRRGGLTLIELLIALVLVGLVGSLASGTLRRTERETRARLGRDARAIVADDIVRISESALASSGASVPLQTIGDTAIDWGQLVARGLPCALASDSVLLPLASPSIWWGGPPDSLDLLVLEDRQALRSEHRVRDVRQRAATAACPSGAWRLRIEPALPPSQVAALPLAHLERRVRFVVYRASDGAWWWGERRCPAAALAPCGTVQPITGPLPAGRQSLRVEQVESLISLHPTGLEVARRATLIRWP
jgi:prepilin-type N-terminal cleavage/methylation domain-containing protein